MTAGVAHMVPTVNVGVAGFGGSPTVTATFGGENVGNSAASFAAWPAGSPASSARRRDGRHHGRLPAAQDEWNLQANLAQAELTQIGSQITAATGPAEHRPDEELESRTPRSPTPRPSATS